MMPTCEMGRRQIQVKTIYFNDDQLVQSQNQLEYTLYSFETKQEKLGQGLFDI